MDGSQFDAWTRRSVGLAAGGLAGSLLAVSGIAGIAAKKGKGKKKRKRCKKFGDHCEQSGDKKCCCGLECRGENLDGLICCKASGSKCTELTADECCSGVCQLDICVCKTLGQGCTENPQCCSGFCDTTGSDQCEEPGP